MKNAFALLAAAAAGPAAATFGHGGFKGGFGGGVDVGFGGGVDLGFGFGKKFHDADRFTCPGNSKNKCDDKFRGGIDWKDLVPGKFEKYLGFDFNGFECIDLGGIGKVITGECGSDRDSAPRFGCGKDSFLDKFSVKEFDIDVEFDARLEFHYDMPDGSLCKQSSDCFKGLNKIINTQCGLATDVRVIFPDQPNKQKDKCKIKIPKIDFDCDDNTPEEPEVPEVPEEPEHPEEPEVPEHPEEPETPEEPEHPEEPEEPEEPETPEPTFSHPPTNGTASSALPTQSSHTTPPQVTTTAPPTTEMTTSTIFTTEIKTITDCGPEVPDCPADGTKVVTETVAISTTVCPVDEVEPTATSAELPEEPEKPKPTGGNEVPELPDLELPCPDVVPKCLNTWLHVVKECKDNLDVSCFCPNKEFVEETYKCLYAHGENDDIVSEAVQFFQGICAPFIPENPGIVTDIDSITSCITVTGTPTVTSVPYTTIVVETTITEPCVSDGVTIPESSTTKTISTEITVPDVPVPTTPVEPVPTGSDELPVPPPTEAPEVPATQPPATTFFTTQPGTISQPVPTSQLPVPTAGAANVKAGLGLGLAVMAVAAAL